MIQAAVEGCLDYKEVRLDDPTSNYRTQLLLAGLAHQNDRRLHELEMLNHLAITLVANLTAESYESQRAASWKCYHDIYDSYWPPLTKAATTTPAQDARSAWVDEWGDPQDPAVAAQIEAVAQSILKRSRARRPASSESPIRTVRLSKRRV